MTQPSLYKYLDVQGAILTLKNRCFRHAKPSNFNDREDLTVRSIFPEDDETAFKQLEDGFVDCLISHIDEMPTCLNPRIRAKVRILQAIFRTNPDAANLIKETRRRDGSPPILDREHMKKRNRDFVAEINLLMQNWRILCVSTSNDSERMWTRYAEDHNGIVLRIVPNLEKDSKYKLFGPVIYREARPALFESAASFQEGSLFGDQSARIERILKTIIYSKTLEWEYESEYRLAIPLGHGERDWNTLAYHPNEIAEIYLGANMTDEAKAKFNELARAANAEIRIFDMLRNAEGALNATPR